MYQDHRFKRCQRHTYIVRSYLTVYRNVRAQSLLTKDSCCFTCFLPTVLCYQTRDANNNYCKYDHIVFSIVFCAFYLQDLLNVHEVLVDFDTTNCNSRQLYDSLMLRKTQCFDTDAIVAIIFFQHVIDFCTRNRSHQDDTWVVWQFVWDIFMLSRSCFIELKLQTMFFYVTND